MEREQDGAARVIARLYPSAPRRAIGAGVLAVLGMALVWLALAHPPQAPALRLFLPALGAFLLWGTVRLWQATAQGLALTADALRTDDGQLVARIAEVRLVSRGALAFKPSNGFLLVTDRPAPAVWAPGLWWRIGRRVGVGGVTGRDEARFMAETIAHMVERRGSGG
ncbi:MAG TPA: hypothetical protein PKD10_13435 [Paracoccaceae bacterium]|nr:hypothetical protein [Paracoccaceae bacterium]HMO70728.1 hypothetical protein [Paracoccaceae bacterium]